MRRNTLVTLAAVALFATALAPAIAAQDEMENMATAAYVRNLEFVGGRVVQLAEAIPQEDYGWRPMEGVRSVSEAIMHIAAANYFFAGRMGTETPEGVDPGSMEEITDKAEVVTALEASLDHLAKAYDGIGEVHAEADIFGNPGTVEDMMLVAIGHAHEHFGQLIAYARSNGVTPPWSQPQESAE
jgi:uncharacterized damage-inducible protein DinB